MLSDSSKRPHLVPNTPVMHKPNLVKEFIRVHFIERTARKLVPKNEQVLDFGCGYGFYFKINSKAKGIDGDPNSVQYVNHKYGEQKVILGNLLERLPIEDSAFSRVLAHDVFEHLEFQE